VKSLANDQTWEVMSYGTSNVNYDIYYEENLVLSDLPAGDYQVSINYLDEIYRSRVSIYPGTVTYFTFRGRYGFGFELPDPPDTTDWMSAFQPN